MTGFEPRTSGVGSDRSTNWAMTTAQKRDFDAWSRGVESTVNNVDI